jgi:predicted RNase H-like HicB family nuclease
MSRYIALIDGKAGAYGVTIPDLPGCTAMGKTTDEALRNAMDAARDWAADAITEGERLPKPQALETLRKDKDVSKALAAGAVLATVPVIIDLGRPARANISIDTGLLNAIDDAAAAEGVTRSGFIASAAREKIGRDI